MSVRRSGRARVLGVRRAPLAAAALAATLGVAEPARAQDQPWFPIAQAATLKSRALLDDRPWAISAFGGYLLGTSLFETFRDPGGARLEDDAVFGLLAQRRLFALHRHLDLEVEGGVAYRAGEGLWEVHGALVLRWDYFPWNDFVYTTFSAALGPSYTFGHSQQERLRSSDGRTSRILIYFSPEITLALPDTPHIAAFVRLHHRSAAFGLIKGLDTSIDHVVFGLRYRF